MQKAANICKTASLLAAMLAGPGHAASARPSVVAAESVYADIARQVAGPDADVSSILTNPATDPHDFEATSSAARALAGARITIANGLGYDAWMAQLLGAARHTQTTEITVAQLLGRRSGDNPHLWYDPAALPAVAQAVAAQLSRIDPAHAAGYAARLARILADFSQLRAREAAIRSQYAGAEVTATEPVFGPMLAALGLADRHARFQIAVMNGIEPRARDIAAFQDDLRDGAVRALVINTQATDPAVGRLVAIANRSGIRLVPVTETLPPGETAQAWIGAELTVLETALAAPKS